MCEISKAYVKFLIFTLWINSKRELLKELSFSCIFSDANELQAPYF